MTNAELIEAALAVVYPYSNSELSSGGVGCALVTAAGNVYRGVCIDTASSLGYCAEHNAVGAMITAREFAVRRIVAVCRDEHGVARVLSPCGRCRELLRQLDPVNLDTEVILGVQLAVKLADLLPYASWREPVDAQPPSR